MNSKGETMKRGVITAFFLLLVMTLISCSSPDSTKFSSAAAQGGLSEVELGRLAVQRGSNPAVKSFGQRMIEDHSRANDELKAIATKKNIDLPKDLNSDQKSMMDKLSKLSGAEFDKEYMSDMVKDHEADAKEFENQANKGTDADIKAFAAKTLPMIQRHLQMARDALNQVSAK
jgi:putative membrane protein